MNSFLEMEWGAKWDWENLVMYGSKVSESPKKLQLTDWGIEEEGEMDAGSFNLSGGGSGSGSGRSGSDLGNGSSGKSSISASTDSSPKDGMKTSSFTFEALKGSFGDISMKTEPGRVELSGTSPPLQGSVGSVEPLIGLKLGKRTYFENSCSGGNAKSPSSVISVPSTTAAKKTKSLSPAAPIPRCQVEGCNLDLSSAKEYHRKHRVCDSHSKCPKVIIGGLERRFCQQCSRFHSLSEFDEKKRSCRRRLSDHNSRRRKPQQETIQFNSSRIPSSFYDGRQQMNFVLNDVPLVKTRNASSSDWESAYSSKFTITRAFPSKPDKAGGMNGQAQMIGNQLPHVNSMHSNASSGFLALKGGTSQVCSQGFKESIFSSTVDAAPVFRRALSLLSTNSCSSYEPESISLDNPVHVSRSNMPQTMMHAIPQGLPLASSEYWPPGQQSTYPRVHTLTSNNDGSGRFEGMQVFKTPYEEDFYHNPLN